MMVLKPALMSGFFRKLPERRERVSGFSSKIGAMPDSACLSEPFYSRDVVQVARDLLGMVLVRVVDGIRLEGIILETEAYRGEDDLASHARFGRTQRNSIMYGPPGRAYVYFTYGIHWMLNCVCDQADFPSAVLIRALLPIRGQAEMALRRPGRPPAELTNGPAKLCQALRIDGRLNDANLTTPADGLFIRLGTAPAADAVKTSPRIGISYAPEPWLSKPWRFFVDAAVFDSPNIRAD
jgi:DNA-3-methyladenine glycosylase